MACTCKAGLGSGFHSGNDLIETFGVCKFGSCKNFTDHGEHEIHLRIQSFASYSKHGTERIGILRIIKNFDSIGNAAGSCIHLIEQFTITVVFCIHCSKHRF